MSDHGQEGARSIDQGKALYCQHPRPGRSDIVYAPGIFFVRRLSLRGPLLTTPYDVDSSRGIEESELGRAEILLARSRQARAYLAHCLSTPGRTPLEKVTVHLVQRQDPDGSWGSIDYPLWTDVITALAVQGLLSAGFAEDATWTVTPTTGRPYSGGIHQAIGYLHTNRSSRGWGEDLHDTCQVLIALCQLHDQSEVVDSIDEGFKYVLEQLAHDFAEQRDSDWYGPGFYAAALDALSLRGANREECIDILEKLAAMQHADGYFGDSDFTPDMKVFHTALCVMSISAQGLPTATASIDRALTWLENNQDQSGGWGTALSRIKIIFTSYAILALTTFRGTENPGVKRGVTWLLNRQSPEDGSIEGIEGIVMALRALNRALPPASSQILPVTQLIEVNKVLQDNEALVASLADHARRTNEELEAAQTEIAKDSDRYLLKVTHQRAGQIGLVVGVVGLLLAILTLLPAFR